MRLIRIFKDRWNKPDSFKDEDGKLNKSMRLEESLQEVQGHYRKLLNHTQAIQYTHDLQGQFLSVDQEITEFLGYDRNSLLNMNIRALLASEVRHHFETYLDEIKRQGVSKGLMFVQTAAGEKRILKYYNTLRTEAVPIPFVQGIAYDVTEQKQTRKTLKQISEQLSIVLKSLPIVCYICNAEEDYGTTYITHNVKAITGFEQTDFTSTSSFWSDRIHPEDAPKIIADLPQIFEKGYREHQYRWQVADGSYKWFYDYMRLIKSSDGKNHIIGMRQDITERKRAEEALKKEKDKAKTYLDVAGVLLVAIDTEQKVTLINKKGCEILGYTLEEVLGKNWFDHFIPERVRNEVKTVFSNLVAGKIEPLEYFENRVLTKSGEEKIIAWHNTVITDESGHMTGTLSSGEDITQSKEAQEALLNAAQQWRTTFDGIGDIVCLLDPEGKILKCNRALTNFLGKSFSDILNRPYWEIIHRSAAPIKESPVELMKETRRREIAILPIGDRWFNIVGDPLLNEAGSLIGAVYIMSDITERRQAAEEVARLSRENAIMAEIGRIINSSLHIDEVYERFSEEVHKLISFDRIEIVVVDHQDHTITIAYITGIDVPGRNAGDTVPMTGTVVEEIYRTRSSQLIQSHNIEEFASRFPRLTSSFQAGLRSMIFVPLVSEDRVIGVLSLRTTKPDAYTEKDLRLTERVGNQIAGGVANARLYIERKRADEAVKRLSQENAMMAEIGRIISSTLNIEEVYERFAHELRKLIFIDRVSLSTINPDGRSATMAYVWGPKVKNRNQGDVFPLQGTLVDMALTRRSGILADVRNEETLAQSYPALLTTLRAGFRSVMSVPLISKDQVIGCLNLHASKGNAYTELDLKLAERVGAQIAGAVANAQLYIERKRAEEAVKRLSQENAVMAEIGQVIGSTLNIDEVYERFEEEVRKLIPFDRIGIQAVNIKDNTTTLDYISGVDVESRRSGDTISLEGTAIGECVRTRSSRLFQLESVDAVSKRFPGLLPTFKAGLRSILVVPLISKDEVIGVFHIRSLKPEAYTESDLKLAERVGNQIAGAIANATLYVERKQMGEALRKSEERFRDLYDYAPLGYHEYDAEGRITSVNRTDFEMLGYTAEEMIGQPIWKFNVEGDALRDQVLAKLAGTSPPGRNLERTYRKKDGLTLPVLVEDRLILDQNGRIKGIRSTIQDITARKQAEEDKASLQEQLRQSQKMEAIGKLAGGVAHDFNNLLTVIHGYSELMLNSLDQDSRLRQDVQEIMHASDRASSLTRQLLAFSRKQVLQPQVLDLNADVSNMDKMLRRMIGEDIELVTLLVKDLGRIKADPGQIEQVLLNLAVNAKDAMLSGGKLTIETANVKLDENYARSHVGVTPGNYVMLSMSDTGVGMTPETKERIFEPFFTTKEKGKGTGLGLSTVYGIIQQSGGNIWVYSEPGLGTTFKIYLPTIEGDTESLQPMAAPTKPMQGSETILLVEDEEMVRKLACTVLEKNGYRVLEASSGDKALDVVQGQNGNHIHLMVTDVVMPGMSGRQLADRLVSLRPELKVLYMSGYTDNAIVHHGVLDQGISYIQKPFTPDALATKVREILDGN